MGKAAKDAMDLDGDGRVDRWEKAAVQHHDKEEADSEERKRHEEMAKRSRCQPTPAIKLTFLLMVIQCTECERSIQHVNESVLTVRLRAHSVGAGPCFLDGCYCRQHVGCFIASRCRPYAEHHKTIASTTCSAISTFLALGVGFHPV